MTDQPSRGDVPSLHGRITYTEFISADPDATRAFVAQMFGWQFHPVFESPAGPYHPYSYSEHGGGGIRSTTGSEAPGSMPTISVDDVDAAFRAAIDAGAGSISEPHDIAPGVRLALVQAPGGVVMGLSGPRN